MPADGCHSERQTPSVSDKTENAAEKAGGKGRQVTAAARAMRPRGSPTKVKGNLNQAGQMVKDVSGRTDRAAKGAAQRT